MPLSGVVVVVIVAALHMPYHWEVIVTLVAYDVTHFLLPAFKDLLTKAVSYHVTENVKMKCRSPLPRRKNIVENMSGRNQSYQCRYPLAGVVKCS